MLSVAALMSKPAQGKTLLDQYLDQARSWQKSRNLDSTRFYAIKALNLALAQNNKTAIAQAALLKAQSSYKIEPREGLNSYVYARRMGIEAGEKAVQFRADLTLGSLYNSEALYDSTKFYYNEAINLANAMILEKRSTDNLRRLGMVYNNYGTFCIDIDQLHKAVYYLIETEKIGREIKDTVMMFRAAVNVGAIYNELGSPENKVSTGYTQKMFLNKAVQYFKIAFNLLTPEDNQYLPSVLNNLGISYISLGKYDSATNYLERALALHIKNDASKQRIAQCHLNLGSAYYKLNRFDDANREFDLGIKISEENDLKTTLISLLSNKGQLYTHWNKLDLAEAVLKRAMALKSSIKGSRDNYLLYEKFYLLYEKKQDFKKAFEYYKMFVSAKDSIADVEHLNILDDLDIKYGTEKKDEKINELSFEKQLLLEKNKTREAQLRLREFWILGLIMFLIMAGLLAWFWMQRNRLKHQQEASDLEHRLLRARMNPHFLFNGLNTIQKHYSEGNTEEANKFMADFSKFLRLILNKTGETKHSLEDEIEFTKLYASLEQRKYPDRIQFKTEIEDGLETEQWMVPSLLFQPVVENAIWHGVLPKGTPGEIVLKVSENANHHLVCTITDNGIGYDTSLKNKQGNHVSKAFDLIQKRLGKNGTLNIETLKGNGTDTGTRITITMNAHL